MPIKYWPEFIHLVQSRINPLCTEAVLRESVQFLQYTGDVRPTDLIIYGIFLLRKPTFLLRAHV